MDTMRTKEKIQAILGYVELNRLGKRKVVFWSYAVAAVGVAAAVFLALNPVTPELLVAAMVVAVLAGLLGYTVNRDHRRWKRLSGELRGWLAEAERELQAEKPMLDNRSGRN